MSSAENEKKNVEEPSSTSDEKREFENGNNREEEGDDKREDAGDEGKQNGYTKSDFLKIPITVSAPKPEKEQPTGEPFKQTDEEEVAKPSQNNTKKTASEPLPEKEIDIVQVPKLPEPGQKYDIPSPRKPHHREGSCCGYRENNPPCHHLGNQGARCPLFSPFAALPYFGYPVMVMPAFTSMGFYGQCMTNMNCQFADCYHSRGQHFNGCCHHQNASPCCPCDETNDRNHHYEAHDHCSDVRRHCHGDTTVEHASCNHHHHPQDVCCENQDPRDMENYYCEQDVNDDDGYDDAKSVEELLEEYLEDIEEKTERIHDILDDYEAMDLFISVHGFQPEEVHVTARGRILTVKGDHQYSEAMWVRVRNFSESYEIPEEFDVSRTTAVVTGDSLCVRIPHVDGE